MRIAIIALSVINFAFTAMAEPVFQVPLGYFTSEEKKEVLINLANYHGPQTFLLSYPRSGNTWFRYCIEFLTQRPTFNPYYQDPRNQPIGWQAHFTVDITKKPIKKTHRLSLESYNPDVDQVILLIRNPKECFGREKIYSHLPITPTSLEIENQSYFENIAYFDEWSPHRKIIIYYEDLITDPETTLKRVLDFLNEPYTRLPLFMKNYRRHKHQALLLYSKSFTSGKDLLHHSKTMSPTERKQIDQWIEELYPLQWEKYLKERYSEAVLHY